MYFYSSPSHATARSPFLGFTFAAHTNSPHSPLTKAKNLEQKAAIEAKFNMEKPAVENGGNDEEDEAHSKKALLLLKPYVADESVTLIARAWTLWSFDCFRTGSCLDYLSIKSRSLSHTPSHPIGARTRTHALYCIPARCNCRGMQRSR